MEKSKSLFSIKLIGYLSLFCLLVTFSYFMVTACGSEEDQHTCDIAFVSAPDPISCAVKTEDCGCMDSEFIPPMTCNGSNCTVVSDTCCNPPTPKPTDHPM
jgi:hypothetical protein